MGKGLRVIGEEGFKIPSKIKNDEHYFGLNCNNDPMCVLLLPAYPAWFVAEMALTAGYIVSSPVAYGLGYVLEKPLKTYIHYPLCVEVKTNPYGKPKYIGSEKPLG